MQVKAGERHACQGQKTDIPREKLLAGKGREKGDMLCGNPLAGKGRRKAGIPREKKFAGKGRHAKGQNHLQVKAGTPRAKTTCRWSGSLLYIYMREG